MLVDGNRLMLDLCSGLGGASAAMCKRQGWKVWRVDNDAKLFPDEVADVCKWTWTGERPVLIWASPPCTEFSRESMPWCKTGHEPDLSIWHACERIIETLSPQFWIIENVRGAQRWMGKARCHIGPFYLWGQFPDLGTVTLPATWRKKEAYSSKQRAERAKVPYEISLAVASAIEFLNP